MREGGGFVDGENERQQEVERKQVLEERAHYLGMGP